MGSKIYLDNNASTFLDDRVASTIVHSLEILKGNPSSTHFFAQQIRKRLSQARSSVAAFFGVKQHEIIFNSGGSEGLNMVIRGTAGLKSTGHIITSSVEHSCVHATLKDLEEKGFEISYLPAGAFGAVKPEAVEAAIRPDTFLIALMSANNETGVKTNIEGIASIAETKGIPFLVDGVALMGKELFSIPSGISAMCFSGHKFHAPQGVGFVYVRSSFKLHPQITGGEQEFGRRAGTENVLGILAMAKAVELLTAELPSASQEMQRLRDRFENELQLHLHDVMINGEGPRAVNVSNLAFAGIDGETLLLALDAAGIAASHGSACSSGALEPSRVLSNMGLPIERVRASLRFSLSRFTTQEEIDAACMTIIPMIRRMRRKHIKE